MLLRVLNCTVHVFLARSWIFFISILCRSIDLVYPADGARFCNIPFGRIKAQCYNSLGLHNVVTRHTIIQSMSKYQIWRFLLATATILFSIQCFTKSSLRCSTELYVQLETNPESAIDTCRFEKGAIAKETYIFLASLVTCHTFTSDSVSGRINKRDAYLILLQNYIYHK